jgi:hypothetical protein
LWDSLFEPSFSIAKPQANVSNIRSLITTNPDDLPKCIPTESVKTSCFTLSSKHPHKNKARTTAAEEAEFRRKLKGAPSKKRNIDKASLPPPKRVSFKDPIVSAIIPSQDLRSAIEPTNIPTSQPEMQIKDRDIDDSRDNNKTLSQKELARNSRVAGKCAAVDDNK